MTSAHNTLSLTAILLVSTFYFSDSMSEMVSQKSDTKGEWSQSLEDYQEERNVTQRRHVRLWTASKAVALFGVAVFLFWHYAPKTGRMVVSLAMPALCSSSFSLTCTVRDGHNFASQLHRPGT
jgi:hypothetical protein